MSTIKNINIVKKSTNNKWHGKLYLLLIALCVVLAAYNVKAEDVKETQSATELAQVQFNPNDQLVIPWPIYEYKYRQIDECCIEFILYATYWPNGEFIQFLVSDAGDVQGGEGNITQTGDANGISAIICASNPPADINILVRRLVAPNVYKVIFNVTIPATLFADCNPPPPPPPPPTSCEDIDECIGVDWVERTETIYLPDFPQCPIQYKYKTRSCGGETQIKGVTISFSYYPWGGDCRALLVSLIADGYPIPESGPIINPHLDPDKIQNLFDNAFRKKANNWFDKLLNETPPALWQALYSCDNPDYLRRGTITSYYRSKCVSYCASLFLNEKNEDEFEIKEDNCSTENCCRMSRIYCLDADNNVIPRETKEIVNGVFLQCSGPEADDPQSCRTENIIFNYRSLCRPTCE